MYLINNHEQLICDDDPARSWVTGITTPELKKITCYKMLHRGFNLQKISGMMQAMENTYDI
jgi:hypothetical protein